MSDGFQMPPALAGDASEVTADGDGLKNVAYVTGGLTVFGIALTVAWQAKNRLLELAGADGETSTITVN